MIGMVCFFFAFIWINDPFSSHWMSGETHDLDQQASMLKADSEVLGKWTSVDFVVKPENFEPGRKSWSGDLLLKEFEFNQDGSTHQPFWSWKDGVVIHSEHEQTAEYVIKAIDGKDYLFLQWINGDVISGSQDPRYYVFIRE